MNQSRLPGVVLRRRDIQALRSAAIALVVLNHLWPERLSGGFIGVDVFFVISGFLITAHLIRELETTNRLFLVRFWAKRALRLLPAALTVLLFCAVATVVWVPLTGKEASFAQIGSAALYALNWVLSATSVDYFAQGAGHTSVTHLWSLSVEEQFYLVWPLILLAVFWVARKTGRRRLALFLALLAIGAASLTWAIHRTSIEPDAAYFDTVARAWEFALGGLVALVPPLPARIRLRLLGLTWLGWAAIAFASLTLDDQSGVPGIGALIPVFGTALIIWIGEADSDWSPRPLLQFRPVQLLGDLSYSIYLWHWPLIVLAPQILGRDIFARDKLILLVITIALAYLTKRYVEDRVRFSNVSLAVAPRAILAVALASALALFGATAFAAAGTRDRGTTAAQVLFEASANPDECFGAQAHFSGIDCGSSNTLAERDYLLSRASIPNVSLSNGTYCQQLRGKSELLSCSFGVPEGSQLVNVALVGDSHAGMWAPALNVIAADRGLRITALVDSACPATLDPAVVGAYSDIAEQQMACEEWRSAAIAKVAADPTIDVVVTSARDRNYRFVDGTSDTGKGYVKAWESWLEAGKRVIVINDIPVHSELVPECIAAARSEIDPCSITSIVGLPPSPMELAADSIDDPAFQFVDYTNVFCENARCHSVVGGIPAYVDLEHLSEGFARSFGSDFLRDELR